MLSFFSTKIQSFIGECRDIVFVRTASPMDVLVL